MKQTRICCDHAGIFAALLACYSHGVIVRADPIRIFLHVRLQTSQNYVHFYAVHTRKESLLPSALFAAKDIQKAEVYLKNSYRVERDVQCLSVSADSRHILLGFADGSLSTLSWSGKVSVGAAPSRQLPHA